MPKNPARSTAIATQIIGEMLTAAKEDGVTFDAEQVRFIEQALSDAALEAFLQFLRELRDAVDPMRRKDLEQL